MCVMHALDLLRWIKWLRGRIDPASNDTISIAALRQFPMSAYPPPVRRRRVGPGRFACLHQQPRLVAPTRQGPLRS